MKKVIIGDQILWYNKKIGQLFYDYKMTRQHPISFFNNTEYQSFLEQIQTVKNKQP